MISVLVVDDSFLMRKLISDILSSDPGISVVGTASDGEEAVQLASRLQPDVITMDLEMPKMSGLAATKRILQESGPRPIVIMLSAFTQENADVTFDCLRAGAFDCILKPSGPLSLDIQRVSQEIIRQVKGAASAKLSAIERSSSSTRKNPQRRKRKGAFPLIVIGASTGGPPVLEDIFMHLPEDLHAAIIVVQHMPNPFTASLAERLDRVSPLSVALAQEGDVLQAGVALIVPGDVHLALESSGEGNRKQYTIRLRKGAPVHGMRPSVDVVMMNSASVFTGPLTGVLLTGMGEDGRDGMKAMHAKGGLTIVQEPSTCVVDGMVRSAMDAGCVDEVISPDDLPVRLRELSLAS